MMMIVGFSNHVELIDSKRAVKIRYRIKDLWGKSPKRFRFIYTAISNTYPHHHRNPGIIIAERTMLT